MDSLTVAHLVDVLVEQWVDATVENWAGCLVAKMVALLESQMVYLRVGQKGGKSVQWLVAMRAENLVALKDDMSVGWSAVT